jgi:glycogen debranching enzyme
MPQTGHALGAHSSEFRAISARDSEATFYIPATGTASRPRRTLKHDDTFAIFDTHGDIGAAAGPADGLFDHDTRFLSHLELLLNGYQPLLLGSSVKSDNLSHHVDLTNPDIYADGEIDLMKDTVHVARTICVHEGCLRERMAITNYGISDVGISVSIAFASDFADIFEVRGMRRSRRGRAWSEVISPSSIALCYRGLDNALRETVLSFEPRPDVLTTSIATFALKLAPGSQHVVFVGACSRGRAEKSTELFFRGLASLRRRLKAKTSGAATVAISNPLVHEIISRCLADMYMLITETPQGPYPYAGIPWFSTTFGRDGIISALQMLWVDPGIARGVLSRLAHFQARSADPDRDADGGKIVHEMRGGEMAALREVPFGLYYGSVDATPLFVILAGEYLQRTADIAFIASIWPVIERAIAWMDGPGDMDGDGFIEYSRGSQTGLANQGWKDSNDAIFHADGRLAEGPIALVEVQAYAYAARIAAADCARQLGKGSRASELLQQAQELRRRFEEIFWCEDIGTYVLALDGNKEKCKVRTSNAGHALFAGIASTERARRISTQLLQSPFYSGWGIRTVAQGEPRYNPMSYHNGSVWPHDNALIAAGFARYGLKEAVLPIFDGMMRAATHMEHRRMPELYCGFRRRPGRGPTLYPVACSPQAWAAGAPLMTLHAMLGIERDEGDRKKMRAVLPVLPENVQSLQVKGFVDSGNCFDLTGCKHADGSVALDITCQTAFPQTHAVRQPAEASNGRTIDSSSSR